MNEKELRDSILKRVKRTYYLKRVLSPVLLKCYFFTALFVSMFALVSVKDVFANMPSTLSELYTFLSYAVLHTEIVVQAILATITIALILIVRDSVRTLRMAGGLAHTY